MIKPSRKISATVLASGVFGGLGGQSAAHWLLSMAPDNAIGFAVGAVVTFVAVTIAHDEGFDRGYEIGKRDGSPGLFDRARDS